MQAAFDVAVEYVHERKQFGKPVGTFQLMQGKGRRQHDDHMYAYAFEYREDRRLD